MSQVGQDGNLYEQAKACSTRVEYALACSFVSSNPPHLAQPNSSASVGLKAWQTKGAWNKAGVEMTIEDGALVLRRSASPARTGWAEAARSIAEAGDDELMMGEFGNAGDSELVW